MKLIIVLVFLSGILFAQAPEPANLDCTKILALGKLHDAKSYKRLIEIRKNHWCVDYWQDLRHALARRGDRAAQRDVVCEIWEVGPYGPSVDFDYIGGWFGIRAALLLADQEDRVRAIKMPVTDVIPSGTPRVWAMEALQRILPDGPRAKIDDFSTDEKQLDALDKWHIWIRAHRSKLIQMNPTGKRVSWTDCEAPPIPPPLPPELAK